MHKKKLLKKLSDTKNLPVCRIFATILGIVILGIGIAVLLLSGLGNDPYTAMNLAYADGFGMSLGDYQLIINGILLLVQLVIGRRYIGFGTIVNMVFLGYMIDFASYVLGSTIGGANPDSLVSQLIYMMIAAMLLSFGVSMYQKANLGISPYDFLSLALSERLKKPYFIFRMFTDGTCVLLIFAALGAGFLEPQQSHLGLGTILCAFCLGPFINISNFINDRWIR